MNVLVASNDNYVAPAIVMLKSLFVNHTEKIDVFYMYYSLSEKNKKRLYSFISKNDGIIHFIKVDESLFANAPILAHFSKEMYLRLLVSVLIPSSIERILYLDPDIIINSSISEFYYQSFFIDKEEKVFIACEEREMTKNYNLIKKLGIPLGYKYFNSGVLLINLSLYKDFDVKYFFDYLQKYSHVLRNPDQDILNAVFYKDVKYNNYLIYNFMPHSYSSNQLELMEKAKIIHYAGPKKPWQYGYTYLGKKEYSKYVKQSGNFFWYFKNKVRTFFPFYKKKIKKHIKFNRK